MSVSSLKKQWHQLQFTKRLQAAFWEDLVSLVEDDVSLSQALTVLSSLDQPIIAAVASSLLEAVTAGKRLAKGMQGWFSPITCAVIDAGENSGTLLSAMQACAKDASQRGVISKAAVSTLTYPLIVLMVALGVMVFVKHSVLESLIAIKPLAAWPSTSVHLYQLASFVEHAWLWLLCDVALLLGAFQWFCRVYTGRFRDAVDQFPLLQLYRQATAWRFMRMLGVLLGNGMMLNQAFALITKRAQPYLVWHLQRMQNSLNAGTLAMADVLDTQLLDEQDLTRLRVLSQHKSLASSLNRLSDQASQRWAETIERIARILAGLLLAASAAVAALLIFGIYTIASVMAM